MKYKNYKEEQEIKNITKPLIKIMTNHYRKFYKVLNNIQKIIINYTIKNILMQKQQKIFKIAYKEVYNNKIIKID